MLKAYLWIAVEDTFVWEVLGGTAPTHAGIWTMVLGLDIVLKASSVMPTGNGIPFVNILPHRYMVATKRLLQACPVGE